MDENSPCKIRLGKVLSQFFACSPGPFIYTFEAFWFSARRLEPYVKKVYRMLFQLGKVAPLACR